MLFLTQEKGPELEKTWSGRGNIKKRVLVGGERIEESRGRRSISWGKKRPKRLGKGVRPRKGNCFPSKFKNKRDYT